MEKKQISSGISGKGLLFSVIFAGGADLSGKFIPAKIRL